MTSAEAGPLGQEAGGLGRIRALDGMRGVAVLLVFLFHLRVTGFGSGFLGVDVFFVLSGFLITGLLLAEMGSTGRIALTAFWARRARRLLPALVLLLFVVAAVTWLTATFSERVSLRGDLLSTTAYVANWHFISTSSYFNSTGTVSPLQHTWSLAIEEQFYLTWPLLLGGLLLATRRPKLAVAIPAAVGVLVSAMLLALLWSPDSVERSYMGTDARIFEPLIGALGALLIASPRSRRYLERLGTPLVVLGTVGLILGLVVVRPDTSTYYFGGAVLVSVATLMMAAPLWLGGGGPLRYAMEWPPLVWIGVVSYGAYLWHWPLIVWLGVHSAHGVDALVRGTAVVVLTFAVAAISYYAIERPIRRGRRVGQHVRGRQALRPRWVLASVPLALLAVASASVAATEVPPPPPGVRVVMLVGDSVPAHLEAALERASAVRGWRIVSAAHGSCPVTGEVPAYADGTPVRDASRCPETIASSQDELIRQVDPDVVVWWDRWSLSDFLTGGGEHVRSGSARFWHLRGAALRAGVQRLTSRGATVVFVATEPPGRGIGTRCTEQRCNEWVQFQIDHYRDVTSRWNLMMRRYAERHPDEAAFVSVTDIVCRSDEAPCNDLIDGVPARPDGTHYEGAGERKVAAVLVRDLAPFVGTAGRAAR